jgi:SNF2 family DNA or RNA helicase
VKKRKSGLVVLDTIEDEDEDLTPREWVPAEYQKVAVKWLLEHAAAGLFADPGLRKTSITLAAMKILRSEGMLSRALVIAPLRPCYGVWDSSNPASELRKWTNFHSLKSVVLHGSGKEERLKDKSANLFIINPDGLEWLMTGGRINLLRPDTLVVDESTMFKHTKTRRFKLLEPYLQHFHRRWILTGTPTPKGLMDLFGQIKVLDLGAALGRYITHYRMMFFDKTGFGGFTYALKEGAEQLIYARLATMVHRIDGEDAGIDLPKLVDNPIYVYLPPQRA